jgi:hypothetical protein
MNNAFGEATTAESNKKAYWSQTQDKQRFVVVIVLFAVILLTNRWAQFEDGEGFISPDTHAYMTIAKAAPFLPSKPIELHHAQRFVLPSLCGLAAHAIGCSEETAMRAVSLLMMLGTLYTLHHALRELQVTAGQHILCMLLLLCNPFAMRFYITFPLMLNDVGFLLGETLLVLALLRGKYRTAMAALLFATVCRQTALLLVPGILLWIWTTSDTQVATYSFRNKIRRSCVVAGIAGGVYGMTYSIVAQFAFPSITMMHLTGMASWLMGTASVPFSGQLLIEFLLRAVNPILFPVMILFCGVGGVYANSTRQTIVRFVLEIMQQNHVISCVLLCIIGVISQPLLGGPLVSEADVTRLVGLSLPLWIVLTAFVVQQTGIFAVPHESETTLSALLLFCGSLHYKYIFTGTGPIIAPASSQTLNFAVVYGIMACGMGAITWYSGRGCRAHYHNAILENKQVQKNK